MDHESILSQNPHVSKVLDLLDNVHEASNGWMARCPAHDDTNPSLAVWLSDTGWVGLKCYAGCSREAILDALGLARSDLGPPRPPKHKKKNKDSDSEELGEIEKIYDYCDENGQLVHQTVRYKPKAFRQRRPDGKGGWIWRLGNIRTVLYRLPQTIEAVKAGETIYVCEGEKDADNLAELGFATTTSPMGAEKWRSHYTPFLGGAHVVILPDNDPSGRRHVEQVARALVGKAKSIKILDLPGLTEKGDDVSVWLERGGTKEEFFRLVAECPEWEPPPPASSNGHNGNGNGELPQIVATCGNLALLTAQAIEALATHNETTGDIYLRGGLIRLEEGEDGNLTIQPLDVDRLRSELAEVALWIKSDFTPVFPPVGVVKAVATTKKKRLPFKFLDMLSHVPVFGPDGEFSTKPGYHEASRTYYVPSERIPRVPEHPTRADIELALRWLDELIHDFPFLTESDRAHAVGLAVTPFVRPMIGDNPTPLFLLESNTPGSGKTLLLKLLLGISLDGRIGSIPPHTDGEELQKKITTYAREGVGAHVIDNALSIKSSTLAMALTATVWQDRILGVQSSVSIPIRWVWAATGNNVNLSADIARRSVRIRLTPKSETPWTRKNFKHDPIHDPITEWAREHRKELIWACLTLVQAWISAGKPMPTKIEALGGFEVWARVIGGILEHAGIQGFLSNTTELYEAADTRSAGWRTFVEAWYDKYREESVTTRNLYEIANSVDDFDLGRGGSERSQITALGNKLAQNRDKVFAGWQIMSARKSKNVQYWWLRKAEEDQKINTGHGSDPAPIPYEPEPEQTPPQAQTPKTEMTTTTPAEEQEQVQEPEAQEEAGQEWLPTRSSTDRDTWLLRRWGPLAKLDFCEACFSKGGEGPDEYHDPVHDVEVDPDEPGLFLLTCRVCRQSHLQEVGEEEWRFYLKDLEEQERT